MGRDSVGIKADYTPRFAIIGTGRMAATMMAAFRRAGVRVTAVASRDVERGRMFARAFAIQTSGDLDSILRRDDYEAVYVANASNDHVATTIAALDAGKAVLCEKPLALSAYQAERVARAASQAGKPCMEAIWTQFLPAQQRFVKLAQAKHFGESTHLLADFGYPVSRNALPRLLSPPAAGVLLDRGIYLIALALSVFGPAEHVDAQLVAGAHGVDECASLLLRHQGGGQSLLAASYITLLNNTASLACSEGMIRLEEPLIGAEVVSTRRITPVQHTPFELSELTSVRPMIARGLRQRPLLRRFKRALPNARRKHLTYGPDPYLPQLEHFVGLLRAGTLQSDVVPLQLSLDIQRIADRARAIQQC